MSTQNITGINISDKPNHYKEISQSNRKIKKPIKKRELYKNLQKKNYAHEINIANFNCNAEKKLFQSEEGHDCTKRENTEPIIMKSEIPDHKNTTDEKINYPYKKINHFEEYLNMYFPNETSVAIDDEIVEYFKQWNYDSCKK